MKNNITRPDFIKPDYNKAEQAALSLLEQFGYKQPPVNPLEIAKDLGTEVKFLNFPSENSNISGFFETKENVICVNSKDAVERQFFTIAHELGHKILHGKEWLKESGEVLYRKNLYNSVEPIEQEANAFAANLLMPKFMMDKHYHYNTDKETWRRIFCVSKEFFENRINFLYGRR